MFYLEKIRYKVRWYKRIGGEGVEGRVGCAPEGTSGSSRTVGGEKGDGQGMSVRRPRVLKAGRRKDAFPPRQARGEESGEKEPTEFSRGESW